MSQKSGNNVKPPATKKGNPSESTLENPNQDLTEQNQVQDTGPLAEERRIGQHVGKGRPPLMKK